MTFAPDRHIVRTRHRTIEAFMPVPRHMSANYALIPGTDMNDLTRTGLFISVPGQYKPRFQTGHRYK
jgi:hypothetical protein